MWFLRQLLHPADVLFTSNEGSNQFSAFVGEITQTPNSVNQPSGFLRNGKDSQIKNLNVLHARHSEPQWGIVHPNRKQILGSDGVAYSDLHCLVGACHFSD